MGPMHRPTPLPRLRMAQLLPGSSFGELALDTKLPRGWPQTSWLEPLSVGGGSGRGGPSGLGAQAGGTC